VSFVLPLALILAASILITVLMARAARPAVPEPPPPPAPRPWLDLPDEWFDPDPRAPATFVDQERRMDLLMDTEGDQP